MSHIDVDDSIKAYGSSDGDISIHIYDDIDFAQYIAILVREEAQSVIKNDSNTALKLLFMSDRINRAIGRALENMAEVNNG